MKPITLVFVHGWSVTDLHTYGELPLRLKNEAALVGLDIQVEEIFLGRYISFHDEVTLADVSRAFDTAVKAQVGARRFVCITHSTGGPVLRDWCRRYYANAAPPVSHLIMLAPANFGSALARLGKSKLGRLKSELVGVEPGQGVLDWLECGSAEAWELNEEWIRGEGTPIGPDGVFPFVITGQSIDRQFYDQLNSYTGELGSDGVVRASSANLNAVYIRLVQEHTVNGISRELTEAEYETAPPTPFHIVKGKSHSGDKMGIMRSIRKETSDVNSRETVDAIFDCIKVTNAAEYAQVTEKFAQQTAQTQQDELIETVHGIGKDYYIHDRFSQVIFRVTDSEGHPVKDYDLIFTGENDNPNLLPAGFFKDRQQNENNPDTITYYFNYDVMKGAPANLVRKELPGISMIGLQLRPRPDKGFVRYIPCSIRANAELLDKVLKPNATTLLDIVIQRVVSKEVFVLEKVMNDVLPVTDFKHIEASDNIVE